MSTTQVILLQKAATNLFKDTSFSNRWIPLRSIETFLNVQYKFNETYPLSILQLSKALMRFEPMIKNLEHKHTSGLYRASYKNKNVYYNQQPE